MVFLNQKVPLISVYNLKWRAKFQIFRLRIQDSDWLNFIPFSGYNYKLRLVSILRKRVDTFIYLTRYKSTTFGTFLESPLYYLFYPSHSLQGPSVLFFLPSHSLQGPSVLFVQTLSQFTGTLCTICSDTLTIYRDPLYYLFKHSHNLQGPSVLFVQALLQFFSLNLSLVSPDLYLAVGRPSCRLGKVRFRYPGISQSRTRS